MFDSSTFTQEMLANPTKLMLRVIDAMEKQDSTGQTLISDPNNGFVMQLSASLAVQAKFSETVDNKMSFLYPQRARNAEQLYPHLSEFDFVKLMASPATLPFVFAMSADWVRANGVYYDDNYDRLVIPETSFITMGGIIYSMYYPIEILINRNTGAIGAYYDGSFKSTLNTLESNMLIDSSIYTKDGINYFQIQFNMYQFERNVQVFTAGSEEGFVKTLSYEDQFYAVKIFTVKNGVETELNYSLSQLYYDYQTPTAILSLLSDTSQLKIKIPQIYFDNNQIAQTIKVELYTTKGQVNYTLSAAEVVDLKANFDTSSSEFAAPFEQMPVWQVLPTTIDVVGGSNPMTYNEVRDAIVNQRLSDRVAVTTPEVIEAGKRAGFNLTRIKDDLTERIYFASNVLKDANEMIIPTFTGNILLKDQSLTGDPSSILNHTDGYYTILPTCTFTVSPNTNTCIPMTDSDVAVMNAMTKQQMVDELNKGIYVRQPFHVTLKTDPKSPQTMIYNLLSPKMKSLVFIAENAHSAPQMSVTAVKIDHLNKGTGGYQIILGMTRSVNIEDANIANFTTIFSCLSKNGEYSYLPAQYLETVDGLDRWLISLNSNYHLSTDDYLTVEMYDNNDILSPVEISLNQTFSVVTSFAKSFDPTVPVEPALNAYLPQVIRDNSVAMMRQTMTLSLGENLSSQIYCGVNTSWGNDVYKTADETVYYTTEIPVFQTVPENGIINTFFNQSTGKVEVVTLYLPGDTPADTQDFAKSVTANVAIPSGNTTVIPLSNTSGVLVGMKVRGAGIPVASKVTAKTANSVTISKKISAALVKDAEIIFTNPYLNVRTSAVQSALGKTLSIADTSDLLVGQSVFGFNIPVGARVESIVNATDFTLTIATTTLVANTTLLTFINKTAPGVVKTAKGDILRDATGKAIIVKRAQNQYMIPSILFDGRLFASEDPVDQEVIGTISSRLNNFANQISTIDAGLIEDSDVYYKPARSMGFESFGIGAGQTVTMPLTLSFAVTVYVDISVYNTQTVLSSMDATIIEVLNEEVQKPVISISVSSENIRNRLGVNAAAVEMGPISGRAGLNLVSLAKSEITPSIENRLVIETDGHIKREPNVTITYVPKPDTALASTKTSL